MGQVLKCQNCGSNLSGQDDNCSYCGARIHHSPNPNNKSAASNQGKHGMFSIPVGEAEFGISGGGWLTFGLSFLSCLYGLGWILEDTQYWLDTRAMIIWTGVLPIFIMIFASLLNLPRGQFGFAIILLVLITLIHLGIVALIRGGINDDMIGISMLISSVSFLAWLIGRLIHLWVRYISQ